MYKRKMAAKAIVGILAASLSFQSAVPAMAATDDSQYVVVFYRDAKKKEIGLETIKIPADVTEIDEDMLDNVPDGYTLTGENRFSPEDGVAEFIVEEEAEAVEDQYVVVIYKDEDDQEVGLETIRVAGDAIEIDVESLTNVPDGYTLTGESDFQSRMELLL